MHYEPWSMGGNICMLNSIHTEGMSLRRVTGRWWIVYRACKTLQHSLGMPTAPHAAG